MRIYIVLYHHKHGYDTFFVAAASEDEAIGRVRANLVALYSEEEVAAEAAEYGMLQMTMSIVNGEIFEYDGARYRVRFERLEEPT